MTDPFDVLRLPPAPLAPDPGFAARLRAELARALAEGHALDSTDRDSTDRDSTDDRGAAMTTTQTTQTASDAARMARTGRPTINAYLAVGDARRAVQWYADVFAGEVGESVEMPDGRLGHAEVRIGASTLMMADEFAEMGLLSPLSRGGTTVSIVIDVDDVDATTRRAEEAGATVEREPADMPYGFRAAAVVDPFGHRWLIETPLGAAPATSAEAPAAEAPAPGRPGRPGRPGDHDVYTEPGDIVYVTWRVKDEQRTARFFGELLGWTVTPGSVEHGLQVDGPNVMGGLWGQGDDAPNDAKLMYHVPDIAEAVAKVRALGGTASEPELMPYGWSAECTDDQGMEFWLYTPAEG